MIVSVPAVGRGDPKFSFLACWDQTEQAGCYCVHNRVADPSYRLVVFVYAQDLFQGVTVNEQVVVPGGFLAEFVLVSRQVG